MSLRHPDTQLRMAPNLLHVRGIPIAILVYLILIPPALAQDQDESLELVFEPRLIQMEASAAPLPALASNKAGLQTASVAKAVNSAGTAAHEVAEAEEIRELNETIAQYEKIINESEAYAMGLNQAYLGLGTSYQEKGQLTEARNAFLEALQITRANNGLFSLEQKPILEKIVEVHLANGEIEAANDQQEHLTYIQVKAHGELSPRLLVTLNDYADWNLSAASRNLGFVPDIRNLDLQPVTYFDDRLGGTISLESTLLNLQRAQQNYAQMLRILLINHDGADLRIPEVEKKMALTYYLTAYIYDNFQPQRNSDDIVNSARSQRRQAVMITNRHVARAPRRNATSEYYAYGRNALIRRIFYLESIPDISVRTVIDALVDLGDWYLLFNRWNSARYVYESSRNMLVENGASDAELQTLVYPHVPTQIPSFTLPPHSRRANNIPEEVPLDYHGYIDLAFEINRVGMVNNIQVLDKSEGTSREVEETLLKEVSRSRFRLQLSEDEPDGADVFRVRYYYGYQPTGL